MGVNIDRVNWEDGTLVSSAKVNVGGTVYEVTPEVVTGRTPTSAENFQKMENNIIKVGVPTGTVTAFAGDVAPDEWLLCDGSAVDRTTYADLFVVIGTKYGSGNGATTFNLPNYNGRTLVGVDSTQTEFATLGQVGGEKTHTLTVDEMPSHQHELTIDSDEGPYHASGVDWMTGSAMRHYAGDMISSTGGNQPHNILQPYATVNYIIKI